MKKCKKCGKVKDLTEFPKNKRYSDGYLNGCKLCTNKYNKQIRNVNIKSYRKNAQSRYYKDVEKSRAEKREYCKNHREEKSQYDIIYRKNNKNKIALYKKQWEKSKSSDPIFKIKRNLRRRVNHVLKGNNKSESTFQLIGCSAEKFKVYLESKFLPGMSWENYGPVGWHIDHIVECYKFDLSDPKQQRQCFHYTNQRPLWAKDNLTRRRT